MIRKAQIKDVSTIYKLLQEYGEKGELLPRPLSELYDHLRDFWVFVRETDDKGQYPEDAVGLKYMFDWWGDKCVNPEYDQFRK